MEQLAGRAEHLAAAGDRLELVDEPIDLLELRGVTRAEVPAARHVRDRRQGGLVERGAGTAAHGAQPARRHFLVRPDAHRVDRDPLRRGEAGRGQRFHPARGVGAVGQQHEHPLFHRSFAKPLHREADRVADRGLLAGEPQDGLRHHLRDGVEIQGERRPQVRAGAEQDEADPVAGAAFHEVARHPLHDVDAALEAGTGLHVPLAHASGEVESEHEVAPVHRKRHGIAHPLRARGGKDERTPREQRDDTPHARARRRRAVLPPRRLLEVRNPDRRPRRVGRARRQARHQERRRRGGDHPGPDKVEHGTVCRRMPRIRVPCRSGGARAHCTLGTIRPQSSRGDSTDKETDACRR